MAVALEVRLCQFLVAVRGHDGGVEPDAGHALEPAVRDLDRRQRAMARDAVRPRVPPRLAHRGRDLPPPAPPAAISFSDRQAVGTDATGPNSSRWSPITRKSLITRAPSAIAHARSEKTRPRSWPPRGEGSAAERPAVRPVRSASCRSRASPACDTTPVPPPVTSRPRDHPVAFTWKVLLELE